MRKYCGVIVVLVVLGGLGLIEPSRVSEPAGSCLSVSLADTILRLQDSFCYLHHRPDVTVIEGDEVSLQKALHLVYSLGQDYVALLFYASWCPFSRNFRPSFSKLYSLYPSIPHFAIEESSIRPSILSKYGVHGFPTLFLLNSTMRVRYRGSRSLDSLVSFYGDVTGIKGDTGDQLSVDQIEGLSNHGSHENNDPESCPFSWARSPENLLQQETYLALAITFVVLRLLYFLSPYLIQFARQTWENNRQHVRIGTLWEHPLRYLNRAKQILHSMKEACKGTNFQEGAINASAWASQSLASAVAIGDASTSRSAQ